MADAPKIIITGSGKDSLRTGAEKINQAIDNSNEALTTANTAKTNADNAVTTANAANAKSDDTQQQLNNIVINNGQSDAEVLQARGTYAVLNDRLNNADSQISEITPYNNYSTVPTFTDGKLTKVEELDGTALKKRISITYNSDGTVNTITDELNGRVVVSTINYVNGEFSSVSKQITVGGL